MKLFIRSLVIFSIMLCASGLGGSASGAQQTNSNTAAMSTADSSQTADPVGEVADFIYENFGRSGFAGIETVRDAKSITVFWHGSIPAELEQFAVTGGSGVVIKFRESAEIDRADAESARDRILASSLAREAQITSISISHEGLGLSVTYANAGFGEQKLLERLQEVGQTHLIQVTFNQAQMRLFASRGNDAAPWRAGARTVHYGQQTLRCTTGFAALTSQGYGRLLSAGHCDPTGNGAVTDGNLDTISSGGTGVSLLTAYDSLLIDPVASPATQPSMYYGAYSSSSSKSVLGWATNWYGDSVCASGASTGSHCGTVYDDNDTFWTGYAYVPVIQAAAPAGSIMAGHGDSGAPVTMTLPNGVQARGIAIGNDPLAKYPVTTACGTVNPDVDGVGYECSRYLSYVPISLLLNAWNLTLETA